jgi:regulator of protease activity HflC (stomatin/prohibitin superfamily)
MITRNTDKLRREVAAHVVADTIAQGIYWDEETQRGCFIGCLAHSDDPEINEAEYGLPIMLQRIAETIFEGLPAADAKAFFADLPNAVGCDGKDLSRVGWQFLAAELRSLPPQPADIQAVIDPVIAGIDRLANGQDWPAAYAANAANAAYAAYAATANAAAAATEATAYAATEATAYAATEATAADAAYAARDATAATARAAYAATATATATATANAARLRQRDLLLQLISDAPTS